jgi:chemotaxis protein methyltransferase CheR
LNSQDFEFVVQLLHQRAGIVLTADRLYLMENRLAPVARKEGLPSIDDLITVVRSRRDERLIAHLIDAMTTHETSFFRDRAAFAQLRDVMLPGLGKARSGSRIRIWSAGCSTGQEAYSIAMLLDQDRGLTGGAPVEIVASDLSESCLDRARQGLFTQFEVQRGLPIQMLMCYFTQQGDHWRISERLRQMVSFRKMNLMDPVYRLGEFDIILCRNVLGGFDEPTQAAVIERLAGAITPGGFLMLGAAETIAGRSGSFEMVDGRSCLFRRAGRATKVA